MAEPSFDFIHTAREEGPNIIQDFHESMTIRGGKRYAIIANVCAFANTNGGTLYIGLAADPKKPVSGVVDPEQAITQLEKEINNRLSPPLQCTLDIHETMNKKIIRVLVPRGDDPPYAVDDSKIYIRSESETGLAVRDEIVGLVLRGPGRVAASVEPPKEFSHMPTPGEHEKARLGIPSQNDELETAPRTGVEVVSVEERNEGRYYTMRDLRNNNVVKNVTRTSARRLWHYAITSYAKLPADPQQAKIQWMGDFGLIGVQKQGKEKRYDLAQHTPQGYRFYFGVTDDGIHGPWKNLVGQDDD